MYGHWFQEKKTRDSVDRMMYSLVSKCNNNIINVYLQCRVGSKVICHTAVADLPLIMKIRLTSQTGVNVRRKSWI